MRSLLWVGPLDRRHQDHLAGVLRAGVTGTAASMAP